MIEQTNPLIETILSIEHACEHRGNDALKGVYADFADFDKMTGGFRPGNLYGIGSITGGGKTSMALSMMRSLHLLHNGAVRASFLSTEESRESLLLRNLCMESGISLPKVSSGYLSEARDFPRLQIAAAKFSNFSFRYSGYGSPQIELVLSTIVSEIEKGSRVVFVDCLHGIMEKDGVPRHEHLTQCARKLKALAMDKSVSIVVTLRTKGKRHQAEIIESGYLIHELDAFLNVHIDFKFIELNHEEEIEEAGPRAFGDLLKNRNGACGSIPLSFHKTLQLFHTRARDEDDE
jgi:replicative DNA helicase